MRFKVGKVVSEADFVKLWRPHLNDYLIAVAVHVLALSLIAPQVMGGVDVFFYRDFVHNSPSFGWAILHPFSPNVIPAKAGIQHSIKVNKWIPDQVGNDEKNYFPSSFMTPCPSLLV